MSRKQETVNSETLSVLADATATALTAIEAALAEQPPADDAPVPTAVKYVCRLYDAEQTVSRRVALIQYRMGHALLKIRRQVKHGGWGKFVEENFPFSIRTAWNYMQLAIGVTEDDARREGVTTLYERAGIIPLQGHQRRTILFQEFDAITDAACKLPTQAKKLTTDFDSLLTDILRRGLSDQPEVTTTALDHAIRLAEQFREIASQFQEMAKSLPERVTERFPNATPTPDDPDDLSPQSVTVPVVTNAEGERFHADGVTV